MKPVIPTLEAAWRQKTIEQLEKRVLNKPHSDSGVIRRSLDLRKTLLGKMSADDVRVLLDQQEGFPYTPELALEFLDSDLFLEACYYHGDLLHAVIDVPTSQREQFPHYFLKLSKLASPRIQELRAFRPRLNLESLFFIDAGQ